MIDFHCHLDLYADPHAVAAECGKDDLDVLSVTTTPLAWTGTLALARGAPRILTALGLHPELVAKRKDEITLFERLLPEARFVGEVGLDGSPQLRASWEDQRRIFERILQLCTQVGGRIMSIHSRRAATPVLDSLSTGTRDNTSVLHWFSGNQAELKKAMELGCWFSVGLPMLTTAKGRSLVAAMPKDRVLTETDGPFVQQGGRPTKPQDIADTVAALAGVWEMSPESADQLLRANFTVLMKSSPRLHG
jgi:TatD DNase family protein